MKHISFSPEFEWDDQGSHQGADLVCSGLWWQVVQAACPSAAAHPNLAASCLLGAPTAERYLCLASSQACTTVAGCCCCMDSRAGQQKSLLQQFGTSHGHAACMGQAL